MNALGLLSVGLALWAVPDVHPGWFPGNGWDGTNAQALWLYAMGAITTAFGLYYLTKTAIIPLFWRWAIFRPTTEGVKPVLAPAAADGRSEPAEDTASVPVSNQRLVA